MEHSEIIDLQQITLEMQKDLLTYKFKNPNQTEKIKTAQERIDKINIIASKMAGKLIDHQTFESQLKQNEYYFNQVISKL